MISILILELVMIAFLICLNYKQQKIIKRKNNDIILLKGIVEHLKGSN